MALPFCLSPRRITANLMPSELRVFSIVGQRGAPFQVPPGNTLASLRRAIEIGAEMLEVDVRRTRDDVLVLDQENVHLMGGEEKQLRDFSYRHWRQHGGQWGASLTRLDDVVALAGEQGIGLILDFKEPGTEALLARFIRASGFPLDSLVVAGAGETSRKILRGLDPRIPLSLTLDMDQAHLVTPKLLLEVDTEAVTWHHRLLTPSIVEILHRRDILVYAFTVDLAEDMRRMRQVCKVDGIITNSPDVLKAQTG